MKAIKVLMIALVAAFTVGTVNAQTAPAKQEVKVEKKAGAKHTKKKGHKGHHTKKVAAKK